MTAPPPPPSERPQESVPDEPQPRPHGWRVALAAAALAAWMLFLGWLAICSPS